MVSRLNPDRVRLLFTGVPLGNAGGEKGRL